MEPFVISKTTYFLIAASLLGILMIIVDRIRSAGKKSVERIAIYDSVVPSLPEPPGPKPWPIIGSLHILGKYEVPYMAFADLAKQYKSQVVSIRLGSLSCVVVNGLENIKEVLFTKACHFDSRPSFDRFAGLFGGDKENSLAFSNWSELQKSRREVLRAHTFPRAFTPKFDQLNRAIVVELESLLEHLDGKIGVAYKPKHLILHTCANVFTNYFCSRRFDYENSAFRHMIENFDKIFFEVNQGYAADFIPSLMPLHKSKLASLSKWSHEIRDIVNKNVIRDRYSSWSEVIEEKDFVDCILNHVNTGVEPAMTWNIGLFALEDIIGGHSAIGNWFVKVLGFIAPRPWIQKIAQREIDNVAVDGRTVGLENRGAMPYVEAVLFECIRLIASPIVPHVANQDSSIAGYSVKNDTFIFLNNYELSMSDELWESPKEFMPERFLKDGKIFKPEHFLPFGGGRRSCMGYKLVQYLGFTMLATILKNYNVTTTPNENYKVPIGDLALDGPSFEFIFESR